MIKSKIATQIKLSFVSVLISLAINAQTKYTISGTVKDKKTGEQLIGAVIRVEELKGTGVACNEYGFYSLTLPEGNYTLKTSMLGYTDFSLKIDLNKNIKHDLLLEDAAKIMDEVVISAEIKDKNVTQAQMGMETINIKEINKIPVLMGEKDVLKTMQLIPGIKSARDGNAGFYVRGGGADQNLILLDEAPVYNASHLLGFFSTFNSDAIKDVAIYKGTMPAQYGGRLSSALDIKMNDGDDKKVHVKGGLGLIASKLAIEGPLVKNKGSFLITGRRTYADLFLKLSDDSALKNSKLYFYDLNLKANYTLNDKNRIVLSGYFGRDVLGIKSLFGIDWGNTTATLRWNHIVNAKLFSNTSFIYSNYSYKLNLATDDISVTSKIQDYNFKQEFQYFPNPRNKIRMGLNAIHHTIVPGQISSADPKVSIAHKLQNRSALDNAIYIGNEWKASEKLTINYGLRFTSFTALGKGDFFTYDKSGTVTETKSYKDGENVKTYFNLEPRFSASYVVNEQHSVKAAYTRNAQNLHLISNSTAVSPTDLYILSSKNTKAEIADQVSLGYFRNFKENKYEFSAEVYYKAMQNQIDYKDGANTIANDKIEGELLYGIGRAYGLELFFKKKFGKFNGWVGYTLSKSEKKIDGINNDKWYNAKQDKTHDISIVGIYDFSKKWSVSATWVYSTGNAVTFPTGKYTIDGQTTFSYSDRNGARMPSYHRLDIGATWQAKKTEKFESSWNFSVYNAYNRANAYSISFRDDPNDPSKTQAVQTTLFRIVPAITYNFKF